MIGKESYNSLKAKGWNVTPTVHSSNSTGGLVLDLGCDPSDWPKLPDVNVVLIAAAVPSLVLCQRDPKGSRAVNVDGVVKLARGLAAKGCRILFLSSNHVFDGIQPAISAEAPTNPKSEYGRQKRDAEDALLSLGEMVSILRITKVLTPYTGVLPNWAHDMRQGHDVHAFSDFSMAPISLDQTVEAITSIMENFEPGIFQLSGDKDVSYLDTARILSKFIGSDPAKIRATNCSSTDQPAAHFPAFSTLDTNKLIKRYGLSQPSSQNVIEDICETLSHSDNSDE